MPLSKTSTVISNNITLTAGGGTTTTSSVNCTTGGPKTIFIKFTNGATGPSSAATATIQASADDSNYYDYTTYNGGTGNSQVVSYAFQIPLSINYIRIVWTAGTGGSNITARAELTQVAERSDSLTDSTNALIKAGDSANSAIRCNIVAGGGTGNGTSMSDKGTFTEGTTAFTPVGGVFNETISADPTEDQAAAARITAKRAVHTNLRNVAGTEVGTSTDPVRVDPTGTTTQPVSQATASNLNAQIVGELANDAADSGNPIKIGGQARTSNPTAVANADRVNAMFDKVGRLITSLGQCRELITNNHITLTSTVETTLLAAGGAGVFHDLIALNFANTSATATTISIRDTTFGPVRFSFRVAAGASAFFNLAQLVPQTTANSNWTAQLVTAVTDVRITIVAMKNI